MSTTETSVALSLAELTRIEEDRIENERSERARGRAARVREERESEARRLAAEQARLSADEEARQRVVSEAAIERARAEARERARVEVARIEVEAKIRLDADNAVRAHELTELRVRRETGRRRREIAVSAALALVVTLGGLGIYDANTRVGKHERTGEELRERERALLRERDDRKQLELKAIELRQAALLARPRAADAKAGIATAAAAHAAIDARAPAHDRVRAFAEALDALEERIDALDKIALLDQRRADLSAWASASKRTKRLDAVNGAASRAKAAGAGMDALLRYERALDGLGSELAERAGAAPRSAAAGTVVATGSCQEGDPGCGIDGRPLF